MEKSSNSVSPSKAREWKSSDHDSSWNFYIEKFYCDNIDKDYETNCIASRFENTCKSFEKVCCGKRKRKWHLVYDDALEDTASSSDNTPKEETRNHSANVDERIKEMGVFGEDKEHKEETELKKIGLCLVPISLVEEYLKGYLY